MRPTEILAAAAAFLTVSVNAFELMPASAERGIESVLKERQAQKRSEAIIAQEQRDCESGRELAGCGPHLVAEREGSLAVEQKADLQSLQSALDDQAAIMFTGLALAALVVIFLIYRRILDFVAATIEAVVLGLDHASRRFVRRKSRSRQAEEAEA